MENSAGYLKLMESVKRGCAEGENCFNPNGCDKTGRVKCFHKYCNQFKWVIDRANHYAEKLGIPAAEILDSWEKRRSYWYMNYYQDCNQPLIEADNVRVFNNVAEMLESIGENKFRCPLCGGVSTNPYECNSGVIVSKIKDGKDGPCNWKVYGLFGDLGKGTFVYCKYELRGERIFMPLSWEKEKAA